MLMFPAQVVAENFVMENSLVHELQALKIRTLTGHVTLKKRFKVAIMLTTLLVHSRYITQ